jgi:hypothetical protein
MKNYIYLFFLSTFLLIGCDNIEKTQLSTAVINSYLFHTEPELLPSKKLIKHQTIHGSNKKSISYNDLGYVQNYDLESLYGEINYDAAKYIYTMQNTKNDYDITFDKSKNIINMKDSNGKIVVINKFNDKNQLIESTLSNFANNNIVFKSKIVYEGNQIEQVLYNAYITVDDNIEVPILMKEKDFVYNTNKQLKKTINKTFKLSSKDDSMTNDKHEQELESTETCTYSDYNENNDWTKAVCETTGDGSSKIDLTRTIEYQ